MLCVPTLEYKQLVEEKQLTPKKFLHPWNKTVLSRTRAEKSEISEKSVELFQESVHSFLFPPRVQICNK